MGAASENRRMSDLAAFRPLFENLKTEMQKAIVGYDELLTDVLVAIFSGGHVLLTYTGQEG